MPPSFRRCSLPVTRIHGDTSVLPVVNRLPIPGIILGGETTITGFSSLEAETPSDFAPLIARWEDRVVFSFSLLTVLQRLDLPLDGVEVFVARADEDEAVVDGGGAHEGERAVFIGPGDFAGDGVEGDGLVGIVAAVGEGAEGGDGGGDLGAGGDFMNEFAVGEADDVEGVHHRDRVG